MQREKYSEDYAMPLDQDIDETLDETALVDVTGSEAQAVGEHLLPVSLEDEFNAIYEGDAEVRKALENFDIDTLSSEQKE